MPKGGSRGSKPSFSEDMNVLYSSYVPYVHRRPVALDMYQEWFLSFICLTVLGVLLVIWLIIYLINYSADHPLPQDRTFFRSQFRTGKVRSEKHEALLLKIWQNRRKEDEFFKPNVPIPPPRKIMRKPARSLIQL